MAAKCQLARAKLAQFTSSLKTSTTADRIGTGIKAGYLASLKTWERNDFGNLTFGGAEYLAAHPTAVAADYIQSVLRSAATFGKVKPFEYRQIANTLSREGMRAGWKGVLSGVDQAVQLMKTGVDVEHIQEKFDIGETTFKNKLFDSITHTIFNALEAQDKPFYGFGFQTSLYGRARLTGIREGLTGPKLSSRVDELMAKPTEEMVLGAHSDAAYVTFKNKTTLSDMAASIRTGIRTKLNKAEPGHRLGLSIASVGIDLTIPFTKVASAITMAGIEYSPFGFAKALIHAADKDPRVQAQLTQQLSRATLGTGLTVLGYAMAKSGNLTGSYPSGSAERRAWSIANKQENSVLVGGTWRSLSWLGPLAIPMLLGSNLYHFGGEGKTGVTDQAGFALGSIGKTMTEQSYMQGVSNLIDAMHDPSRGATALAGMIPIPSIVGQIATAIDPMSRETHGVVEKVQAKIPFASKALPPRLTPFGDPILKTSGGLRGAAESLTDFTNPKVDRSTELTRELERLKVGVSMPGPSFTVQHKKYQRSPSDIRDLTRQIGPQYKTELESLIQSSEYQAAEDDGKRKLLRHAMSVTRRAGVSEMNQ